MALIALVQRTRMDTPARQARPGRARHLRRGAVLRRRHDHAGDLRALGGRGPRGRDAEPRVVRRARSPSSSCIGLFAIQRFGTGAVGAPLRPGHVRLVRRAGRARPDRDRAAARRSCGRCRRPTRSRSSPTRRARRSSRSARSSWPSPAPRRCTPTWATSAAPPIRRAWFVLVFPALVLNYFGQGALVLDDPSTRRQPVLRARARAGRCIPTVALATLADDHRLAGRHQRRVLGHPPGGAARLPAAPGRSATRRRARSARSTCRSSTGRCSRACSALVVGFGSSTNLASAYGIAVTGTLAIDTLLFFVVVRLLWRKPWWIVIGGAACFLTVDLAFFTANIPKIAARRLVPARRRGHRVRRPHDLARRAHPRAARGAGHRGLDGHLPGAGARDAARARPRHGGLPDGLRRRRAAGADAQPRPQPRAARARRAVHGRHERGCPTCPTRSAWT